MSRDQTLVIRRSARHDIVMAGQYAVAPEHLGMVRLSAAASGKDGWVEMSAVDASCGGIGFIGHVYLPRRTKVIIRLYGPDGLTGSPVMELPMVAQRVIMTDRRPAYLFGCSFDNLSDVQRQQIESMLVALDGDEPA